MQILPGLRTAFSVPAFLSLAAPNAAAQEEKGCQKGVGTEERRIGRFLVQVSPEPGKDPDWPCQAIIRSDDGKILFHAGGEATVIDKATGKSISGSGKPEVVFEGYSGGAHCCWTYWILALEPQPKLLRTIESNVGVGFEDLNHDGKIELVTNDGAFDYFDGLCHACSPFPLVVLRLSGSTFQRLVEEYWPRYEKEIAEAKANLEPRCAELFHDGKLKRDKETEGCNFSDTKGTVLQIVLANLYGGREKDAWKALDEYWPPEDLARIRKLIVETAHKSFLGEPSDPKHGDG